MCILVNAAEPVSCVGAEFKSEETQVITPLAPDGSWHQYLIIAWALTLVVSALTFILVRDGGVQCSVRPLLHAAAPAAWGGLLRVYIFCRGYVDELSVPLPQKLMTSEVVHVLRLIR